MTTLGVGAGRVEVELPAFDELGFPGQAWYRSAMAWKRSRASARRSG